MKGVIGEINSVHFEWLLNTRHGADYFRRRHRDKRNSGGLLVHKSTHHFDLVNFWLGTTPKTVFAMGGLAPGRCNVHTDRDCRKQVDENRHARRSERPGQILKNIFFREIMNLFI